MVPANVTSRRGGLRALAFVTVLALTGHSYCVHVHATLETERSRPATMEAINDHSDLAGKSRQTSGASMATTPGAHDTPVGASQQDMHPPSTQRPARGFQAAAAAEGLHKRKYDSEPTLREREEAQGVGEAEASGPPSRGTAGGGENLREESAANINHSKMTNVPVESSVSRGVLSKSVGEAKCKCAPTTSRYLTKCKEPAEYYGELWR